MLKNELKYLFFGLFVALVVGLLVAFQLGLYAIPLLNIISKRMTPLTIFDYIFLVIFSILAATTFTLYIYKSEQKEQNNVVKGSCAVGTLTGFVTFVCPQCPIAILSLIGMTLTLGFLAPYFDSLRIISIVILLISISLMIRRK